MKTETELLEQDIDRLAAIYEPAPRETPGRDILGEALAQSTTSRRIRKTVVLALAASLAIVAGILLSPKTRDDSELAETQTEAEAADPTLAWADFGTESDPAQQKMKNIRKRIRILRKELQPLPDQSHNTTQHNWRYT